MGYQQKSNNYRGGNNNRGNGGQGGPPNPWTARNVGAIWTTQNGKHLGSIEIDKLLDAINNGEVQMDTKTGRPRVLLTINQSKQQGDQSPDFRLYFVPSSDTNQQPASAAPQRRQYNNQTRQNNSAPQQQQRPVRRPVNRPPVQDPVDTVPDDAQDAGYGDNADQDNTQKLW